MSPRRPFGAALALSGCAAILAGCGGSQPSQGQSTRPHTVPSIRVADCSDWRASNADQRRLLVIELRRFLGGPVGSSQGIQNGPVLRDAQAYKLFDSYCANYFARGFKLYKLYDRAAAFVGHAAR